MRDFEKSRIFGAFAPETSDSRPDQSPSNRAENERAYAEARASELLPAIKDEVGLASKEGLARQRFEAAAVRYSRAMETSGLDTQIWQLEAKRASRNGATPPPRPETSELDEAREEAERAGEDHARAARELAAGRERIRAIDGDLRRRFGLGT